MRDSDRIDRILEKMGKLWHRWPDLRLCQLVENVAQPEVAKRTHCIFHVEDDRFEGCLDHWLLQK